MRRLIGALSVIMIGSATAIAAPSPATAASSQFGNGCVATVANPNTTYLMVTKSAANPLPVTAPISGVITKATTTLPPGSFAFQTKLKVARPAGGANQFTILAESAVFTVGGSVNTYDVRVPVTAGDLIGSGGSIGLACSFGGAGDTIAVLASDAPVGSTLAYSITANAAIPLVATVEPDADHDGFGDATQDGCPQSAAYQGACPVVAVKSFPVSGEKSITVLVTTDNAASVTVTGVAKVHGKKIKLKSHTASVNPGDLAHLKVKLPRALKTALAALSPGRTIKVTLTTSATDSIGRVTTSKSAVKLPGTGH